MCASPLRIEPFDKSAKAIFKIHCRNPFHLLTSQPAIKRIPVDLTPDSPTMPSIYSNSMDQVSNFKEKVRRFCFDPCSNIVDSWRTLQTCYNAFAAYATHHSLTYSPAAVA